MTEVFSYQNGTLCAEQVPLESIAAKIGSPFYCYSKARLETNYKNFAEAFQGLNVKIFYAVKASANVAIIRTLAKCGAGADITSAGELERALHAGIKPDQIAYSGVGKSAEEIAEALQHKIHQINVESIPELRAINQVAGKLGVKAAITLRVNPDVDARTNKKISTGDLGTKFGIDSDHLDEAMGLIASLPHLDFKGFHVHIGSHVYDYEPFREAFTKLADMVRFWRGKGFTISRLDLGGGVGIPYDGQSLAPFADYAAIVRETVGDLGCELSFEPGRRLVGDAAVLVASVIYDKQGVSKRFLILDAGMNDLVRPAMYEARHSIMPVRQAPNGQQDSLVDVVGPVCETSDTFGSDYHLAGVGQGDLVAILQAGAYGASMSSNYNGRPLIPEILVSGDQYTVIRRRISVTEQIGWEEKAG